MPNVIHKDDFICYNYMSMAADQCIDFTDEYYQSIGVSRQHYKSFDITSLRPYDVLYVKTDYLYHGIFQEKVFPYIQVPFILVTGASSYPSLPNDQMLNDDKLLKWFCTNPPETDSDKVLPLPIGFEELEREGGDQILLKSVWNNHRKWEDKKDAFYLPYHTVGNNPVRDDHIDYLKKFDFVHVEDQRLPFGEYLKKLDEYKFIICLEGSGYDTHRNYESLLVGSVPIMIYSTVKKVYDYDNLPSIFVRSWNEIDESFFASKMIMKYSFDNVAKFLRVGYHIDRILRYAKG